jgi:hypothetical protein
MAFGKFELIKVEILFEISLEKNQLKPIEIVIAG